MRPIEFRAWDYYLNEMIDNPICTFKNGKLEHIEYELNSMRLSASLDLLLLPDKISKKLKFNNRFEIMQFTGLYDKNNKKIFEGDILKDKHNEIGLATFRNGYFGFEGTKFFKLLLQHEGSEVIGNIHDNPELLEDKNEQS